MESKGHAELNVKLRPQSGKAAAAHPPKRENSTAMEPERRRWLVRADTCYRERRRRDAVFANDALFGEPAWDMLLQLFSGEIAGRPVSVGRACLAAHAPPRATLRWLKILEAEGLVERVRDAQNAQRELLRLTRKAFAKLTLVFAEAD